MSGQLASIPPQLLCASLVRPATIGGRKAGTWPGNYHAWRQLAIACLFSIASAAGLSAADQLTATKEFGPVKVTTRLAPSEPTIGDEVTLEISVEAQPDVEVLMPEFGEALERYTILQFVPKQRIEADGSQIFAQSYTLQPVLSGEQSIPPILIEFVDNRPGSQPSPDDFDAYELMTERIDFKVKSVMPDSAADELKPPMGELELPTAGSATMLWSAAAAVLVLAILLLAVLYSRHAVKRVRKRNAYELARGRLDRLVADRNSAAPKMSVDHFFVEISAIIRRYLEDRFDLKAPELTTDEFLQLSAAQSELSSEHQQLLAEFLKQADIVKFAGVSASDAQMQRSCALAERFLDETRENAPDVEVTDSDISEGRWNVTGPEAAEVAGRV